MYNNCWGDVIVILRTSNGEKQADIIVSFNIEGYDGEYVIYKVDNEYFGAKYKNQNDSSELISDLSEHEKQIINEFYLEYQKEGDIND